MRAYGHLWSVALLIAPPLSRDPDLPIVTDEAEAAIEILDQRLAGRPVAEASWRKLFSTEGYHRLKSREAAMGRAFEDSAFRAFMMSDTLLRRTADLRRTLDSWRNTDLGTARRKALAYLPAGTRIRAKVYLLVKPRPNSFVFEVDSDPAIMLYLDPSRTTAQLENTVAHELHHIGYARACHSAPDVKDSAVAVARHWLGAFGEGVAMLAAAGSPVVHPHAASPTQDRRRWDRDVANAGADLRRVESFLLDIIDGRLTDPDSITQAGMSFFGVQGPWYTVGWVMASTVEREAGRAALVAALCEPARLLAAYNAAARGRSAPARPLWSERLIARISPGARRRGRGAPGARRRSLRWCNRRR
jgi:hypothetical protein